MNEKLEVKFKCILKVCIMDMSIILFKIGSIFDFFVGFFVMKEDNIY